MDEYINYFEVRDGVVTSDNVKPRQAKLLAADDNVSFACVFRRVDGLSYLYPEVIKGFDCGPDFEAAKAYAQSELIIEG